MLLLLQLYKDPCQPFQHSTATTTPVNPHRQRLLLAADADAGWEAGACIIGIGGHASMDCSAARCLCHCHSTAQDPSTAKAPAQGGKKGKAPTQGVKKGKAQTQGAKKGKPKQKAKAKATGNKKQQKGRKSTTTFLWQRYGCIPGAAARL